MSEIYHIIPSFYPLIGGAEKQLERLARVQSKSVNKVYILTRKINEADETPKDFKKIDLIRFNAPNMFVFNLNIFRYIFKYRTKVKLIHVHSLSSVAFTSLFLGLILRIKVLIKITRIGEGSQPELVNNSIFKKKILYFFNMFVNLEMICLTTESKIYINQLFPKIKTCLISNGIEVKNKIPKQNINKEITFIFVSRLIKRKNVKNSIKLMLENLNYNYKIIVCGLGEELDDIVLLAKKNPKIIKVMGQLDENALEKLYNKSNFFVQNSVNEGLSNSFLESLSMNVIPIVSKNKFYFDLSRKYLLPLFFDEFLKLNHDEVLENYSTHLKNVNEMVKKEFDIIQTKNKLHEKYFSS